MKFKSLKEQAGTEFFLMDFGLIAGRGEQFDSSATSRTFIKLFVGKLQDLFSNSNFYLSK